MKFTDGYWHFREGMSPHFPIHVHDIETEPDALMVYGTTKRLTQRGDVLNTGLLTVRFSSPMPDVIRVQMWHHKGQRKLSPTFALNTHPTPDLCIKNEADFASLTSGNLTVRVDKGQDWRVDYLNDSRLLTRSNWRGMGYVDTPEGRYIHEQLDLSVGEYVYGLGERFTPFVKNGQVVDLWNE
ncbi:MAG: hypothetical protein KDD84_12055, partial [Caldilineaceae bacterium]|nr:hypothetical protein [Caldilineaceae bacterium]